VSKFILLSQHFIYTLLSFNFFITTSSVKPLSFFKFISALFCSAKKLVLCTNVPRFSPSDYYCLLAFFAVKSHTTEHTRLFTGAPTIEISDQTDQIGGR
jgi:hypothetical protein